MNPLYFVIGGLTLLLILFFIKYINQKDKNKNILLNLDKEYKELKEKKEREIEEECNKKSEHLNDLYAKRLEEMNKTLLQKNSELNQFKLEQTEIIKKDIEHIRTREENALAQEIELKKKTAEDALKQELEIAKQWFDEEIAKIRATKDKYQEEMEEAAEEYVETLEVLEDFRARREVVNQQILRDKMVQESTDFYRICLTDNEIDDLNIIKEIEHRFNNKEVLHRAAYDCYIKRPLQEMEKRVLNGKKPCGIYCITYFPTGEMYIGRSTDIANRWQEHCKSAYGIGTIAHSSLHTKMARDGIWNFCFQVLEEVPKDKLNEREKYWIEMYDSTNLLNQKAGG